MAKLKALEGAMWKYCLSATGTGRCQGRLAGKWWKWYVRCKREDYVKTNLKKKWLKIWVGPAFVFPLNGLFCLGKYLNALSFWMLSNENFWRLFFFHLRTETCPLHAPLPTAAKRYVKEKKAQPKTLVIKLPPSSYFAVTVQKHTVNFSSWKLFSSKLLIHPQNW